MNDCQLLRHRRKSSKTVQIEINMIRACAVQMPWASAAVAIAAAPMRIRRASFAIVLKMPARWRNFRVFQQWLRVERNIIIWPLIIWQFAIVKRQRIEKNLRETCVTKFRRIECTAMTICSCWKNSNLCCSRYSLMTIGDLCVIECRW